MFRTPSTLARAFFATALKRAKNSRLLSVKLSHSW